MARRKSLHHRFKHVACGHQTVWSANMNLRDIRIGQRLTIGFGLVITLLILLAALALVRIQSLAGDLTSLVDETYPRTVMANRMKADLNEVSRSMLSTLVMSDEGQITGELANI
jgi:methyl-accepting chemotaxis protein